VGSYYTKESTATTKHTLFLAPLNLSTPHPAGERTISTKSVLSDRSPNISAS